MEKTKVRDNIELLLSIKPISYNAESRRKKDFQEKIKSAFQRKYIGSFEESDLYAHVFYFYKEEKHLDADNISKPIWDALKGKLYEDDQQIKIRCAGAINSNGKTIEDFDFENVPKEICYDLMNSIMEENHTLYIEIGKLNSLSHLFNLNGLWK